MKAFVRTSISMAAMTALLAACVVQEPHRAPPPPPPPPPPPRVEAAHPFYAHALSDLRAARWLVSHRPGNPAVNYNENVALEAINAAIGDVRKAAFYDDKDPDDTPPPDLPGDRAGRLHRADELLRRAHGDIAKEEDNGAARGLRNRAIQHVDDALRAVDSAIRDVAAGA